MLIQFSVENCRLIPGSRCLLGHYNDLFFTLTFTHRKTPKDKLIPKENSTIELY